jgi:hypothetical protein
VTGPAAALFVVLDRRVASAFAAAMTDSPPRQPVARPTEPAAAAQAARAEREAAALRENLRRRKQQARVRADTAPACPTGQREDNDA